jgi:siroheme synthase (precorrin-2 oxidase/ferrochelatase)
MAKITFTGWEPGMKKIPFIKLLHEKAGLSLVDAKTLKDDLVDKRKIIVVEINDRNLADLILKEARELKVTGDIEE